MNRYINLNRSFAPFKKDEEVNLEIGHYWGKKYGGWLDWDDLLKKQRVVILAEASSGKTTEFKHLTETLQNTGKAAFFIAIENLADEGFISSLAPNTATLFENWQQGSDEGYFFLDSVDEARLNRKSFERALRKFAQAVSPSLARCRIFISCRVTDWQGTEDYQIIKQLLPLPEHKTLSPQDIDPEEKLLTPIFKDRSTKQQKDDEKNTNTADEITIVWLTPLDNDQRRLFAKEHGVVELDEFCQAIWQHGLENLAERPGDLEGMISYWQTHKKFGSLSEMTEHALKQKLTERDPYRPDNDTLNPQKAREGAEQIAAALTLCKTFTLQAPDSPLAADVLNPKNLLPEWTDAERNALLRRGIFAPASYGRVRFHHRSTQEYLTAQWFKHLLQQGCPRSELFNLLFAEKYGVKTVIPSLKPIAAWLALSEDDVREEILKRDPLILIQHGDPDSLAISTRCQLLREYAQKYETGDIANDSLDHRALWMFAHDDLADTIHEVWQCCDLYDFRGDLIRLIREGKIAACTNLVAQIAADTNAHDYHRIVAIQALANCNDKTTLTTLAYNLIHDAPTISARLSAGFACELFPDYLTVEQLIKLIADTSTPARNSTKGFAYALEELWQNCPANWKTRFIGGLAELALSQPLCEHRHISKKYGFLADYFEPIAHQLITELGNHNPANELIRLLMAVERCDHSYSTHTLKPSLSELVQAAPKIQRALFWADIAEKRERMESEQVISYLDIYHFGGILWRLGDADLPWLYTDFEYCLLIDDKRVALSAIVPILNRDGGLENKKAELYQLVKNVPVLIDDLDDYFKPRQESETLRKYRLRHERYEKEQQDKETEAKTSWLNFRNELITTPSKLSNLDQRFGCVDNLALWLQHETNQDPATAARQWHLIKQAFSNEVAEAYRDAMKALWRDTKPERPQRRGSGITRKMVTLYAYAGIGIEADENVGWALNLTQEEAKRAAEHCCLSEQCYPDWLDALLDAHPAVLIPIIVKTLRSEWLATQDGSSVFLYHYRFLEKPLHHEISTQLFEIICQTEAGTLNRMDCGLSILQRMTLSASQQKRLKKWAITLFDRCLERDDRDFAIRYLVLLFQVDPTDALQKMQFWIESVKPEEQNALAVQIIGKVFNRNDGLVVNSLKNAPIAMLKELVLRAYCLVRPIDDVKHDGVFTPDSRDEAESARSMILSILLDSIGIDAYQAVIELADAPEISERKHRFRQLARGMAERDAEFSSWNENEVLTFESQYIAPIESADALYQCVLNVLDDIRHGFEHSDASSKRLLSKLAKVKKDDGKPKDDEISVQNWLAEQLRLRANGRYHVHREAEVANHNKPDIIVSGTGGQFEIAIEIKQADSWSINELKTALTQQLAEDYLKTNSRRHGILFLTNHGRKAWVRPKLTFIELIIFLSDIATTTKTNVTGKIDVSVFGIDAKA
jgi:hypothetical protein